MTTIVWGHGTRGRGDETTFVPDGTTVKWYSTVDENLLTMNGFLAVDSGDFGSPVDEQGPGKGTEVRILNYVLSEDLVKRDWVSILHRGSAGLAFVGAEAPQGPLCTKPGPTGCEAKGEHDCGGLLGTVKDTELVILVCRGLPGSTTGTAAFGGDAEDARTDTGSDMGQFVTDFMGRVYADPDAAMQEFSDLSTPMQVYLAPWPGIQAFQAVHWGAFYAASGDFPSAFGQLNEQGSNPQVVTLIQNVEPYRARLAQGAAASPTDFFAWVDVAAAPVKDAILQISRVEQVRQGMLTQSWEDNQAATWNPSEGDLAYAAENNSAVAKAAGDGDSIPYVVAGFVLLMGTGHAQTWLDWAYSQPDAAQGTMTIEKGGMFGAGSFTVHDCPPAKQGVVQASIGSFSDKSVTFA